MRYNVTVITSKKSKSTEGKLWLRFETKQSVLERQLMPHAGPIKSASAHKFNVILPFQVSNITSVLIRYKKKNFTQSHKLGIERITIQQQEGVTNGTSTKSFCTSAGQSEIINEKWTRLLINC